MLATDVSAVQMIAAALAAALLTFMAAVAGSRLFRSLGKPVCCPPVLIAALLLASTLTLLGIEYKDYRQASAGLVWLLGPATVALAVPLYQQAHRIRSCWRPVALGLPASALLACLSALLLGWLSGASTEFLAAVAPKSVTAPIALAIAEQIGAQVPLVMGGLLLTGVISVAAVDWLAPRLNIDDERIIGLALGINGHAIGIVRAFEISAQAGAFASLGMTLTAVFTAICLPLVWRLVQG